MKAIEPSDAQTRPAHFQTGRIESLDSLRGLAALAVLLSHCIVSLAWPFGLWWTALPIVNILFDGRSAVDMFFVLSGFVLARPYLPVEGQSPRKLFLPTFYLRRVTRIWIPWFFVFCLSAFLKRFFFRAYSMDPPFSDWLGKFWHMPLTVPNVLRQCALVLADVPTQRLLPQDWSLGVELKGSALIPVFLYLLRKHLLLLLACACVLWPTANGAYYLSFVMGVLTAYFFRRAGPSMAVLPFRSKCVILAVGIVLYEARLLASNFGEVVGALDKVVWSSAGLGCVLILVVCLTSRRVQRVLNHAWVLFLGRVSYSVYLLQFVVLLSLLPLMVRGLNAIGIHQGWIIAVLTVGGSVAATLAGAAVMFRVVEAPSIWCGHRLTKFIENLLAKRAA